MKILDEHIKTKLFCPIYLIYGEEKYMKNIYEKKLTDSILSSDEKMMNLEYFDYKNNGIAALISTCNTMPFMSEKRLIIIKNSMIFSTNNTNNEKIISYINDACPSTVLIFIEEKVDKRLKIFKASKNNMIVCEFDYLDENRLVSWIINTFRKDKKNISKKDALYLTKYVGNDMHCLYNEIQKLIDFKNDDKNICIDDINLICTNSIENKIFDLINNIINKNQAISIKLYRDLIIQKTSPFIVLNVMAMQIRLILKVKYLAQKGYNSLEISNTLSSRNFIISKILSQTNKFSIKYLTNCLNEMLELDNRIKTGELLAESSIEILILKYSLK